MIDTWLVITIVVIVIITVIIILILTISTPINTVADVETPSPLGSSCITTAGCQDELICSIGRCLKLTGSTCVTGECNAEALCESGICKGIFDGLCILDSDCITGFVCADENKCKKSPGQPCLADTECSEDCAFNNICSHSISETCSGNNPVESMPCRVDLICTPTDSTCRSDRGGSCTIDSDCIDLATQAGNPLSSVDYSCINGACIGGQNAFCPNGSSDCALGFQCKVSLGVGLCKKVSDQSCITDTECFSTVCFNGACI